MKKYKLKLSALVGCDSFTEASREELRVLLALIAARGAADESALAGAAGVSHPRVRSALVLWEEADIIASATDECGEDVTTLTEEFEERVTLGKRSEINAAECAREIRNNDLVALMAECAALMDKPALSTEEAKTISAIYTQYSVAEDYILTLAAYLAEKNGRLSITRLGTEAERLVKRGIDTTAELEIYISDKSDESGAEMEVKRLLGITDRPLSKAEKEIIRRWTHEYGYGTEIIDRAYNVSTIITGKRSLPYMDAVLTHWYEAGCKTIEECIALSDKERAQRAAEDKKTPPKIPRTPKKEKPRYGDFDPEEAFKLALARSYRDDDDDGADDGDDTEEK